MGTPDFAVPVLQKLIETQQVVGVVTQPDKPAGRGKKLRISPVKAVALSAEIPLFQPKSLRKYERAEQIRAWQPDVIVVAAFGQILRPHVLDLPPHGCINVHASLLPRWRGASPIQHAILAGDDRSGVCLMHMDVGLDTGDVYACRDVAIAADETAQTLHDKLAVAGADLIEHEFPKLLAGELTAVPQPDDGVTYAGMISKADGQIDWSMPAIEIERQIRAFTPWPGTSTTWNGKQLKIVEARLGPDESTTQAGEVVAYGGGVFVATGSGLLEVSKLQLQGKRAMQSADFLRGRPEFADAILGEGARNL